MAFVQEMDHWWDHQGQCRAIQGGQGTALWPTPCMTNTKEIEMMNCEKWPFIFIIYLCFVAIKVNYHNVEINFDDKIFFFYGINCYFLRSKHWIKEQWMLESHWWCMWVETNITSILVIVWLWRFCLKNKQKLATEIKSVVF